MTIYRESVVVRIDCDPPALLWSGLGPLAVPADAIIPAPAIALGGGQLISVPDFQQLIGGTAERLDFVVSGVDDDTVRLALEDAPSVRGARVDVGTVQFDQDWQLDAIEWENVFEARSLSISRPRSQNGKTTRSITLTIVQGSTRRARATLAFFTDADQRRRSADDAIFSNVAGITAGTSRRFGPND
ncbi:MULTISPECIES: hypothetical protein [unclassified Sphingomonas]|uniref:hypothetical protein n=1 Tax=unclassified Sphingomonas TaxID=196159 RepID=UPI000700AAEF|nr:MULTISPECIES: hypothetical protein [unclassified Sphingomonas]KQX18424.1 hypothetical protein ASD17_14780 [Sphingomonas sp. Root1294]KQY72251.1 hypothetical protein ASD39_20195 [Sphingomonas sp. Root50]KRB94478.1 hypothetical protein ASE22_00555 [Sphingomonas sp. Root720]